MNRDQFHSCSGVGADRAGQPVRSTRTAQRRHDDVMTPEQAEAIRREREGVLRAFCILGTALAVGLMLLHMAGAGL